MSRSIPAGPALFSHTLDVGARSVSEGIEAGPSLTLRALILHKHLHHSKSRVLPSPDAALQGMGVREALRLILFRPTGGCFLVRSVAVEDDFPVFGQVLFLGAKPIK